MAQKLVYSFSIVVMLLQCSLLATAICYDGDLLPHESNCELFYKCLGGSLELFTCPDGLHFNKIDNRCDWPDRAACETFEDKCSDGDLFAHDDNCELFYKCFDGNLLPMSCPPGLHFNPKEKLCDWPDKAECGETEHKCEDGDLLPHEESCQLFYHCLRGSLLLQSCPEGLYFDSKRYVCDIPEQAQCDLDEERCVDGDLVPHANACDRFFLCFEGQLHDTSCPEGLHFDTIEGICTPPENVVCDN